MSQHLYSQNILLPFTPEVITGVEAAFELEIGQGSATHHEELALDALAHEILLLDPILAERLMNLDQTLES